MKDLFVVALVALVALVGMSYTNPTGMATCPWQTVDGTCHKSVASGPAYIGGNLGAGWEEQPDRLVAHDPTYTGGPNIQGSYQGQFDPSNYASRRQLRVRNRDGTYRNV